MVMSTVTGNDLATGRLSDLATERPGDQAKMLSDEETKRLNSAFEAFPALAGGSGSGLKWHRVQGSEIRAQDSPFEGGQGDVRR
jgi:hypothetical protein